MLVPDERFAFSELPGVVLYPDDSSQASFYAIPASPRIATRDDGKPEISLMIRTKKINNQTEVTGGLLTLSTSVGLSRAEEKSVLDLLARKLAREQPPGSTEPPPAPRILACNWMSGIVDLTVAGKTSVCGQPSMMGDNRCAFSMNLGADQAKTLYKSWQQRKVGLSVRYQLKVQAGPPAQARAQFSGSHTATSDAYTSRVMSSVNFSVSSSASAPLELDLEGPLVLQGADFNNSLTLLSS